MILLWVEKELLLKSTIVDNSLITMSAADSEGRINFVNKRFLAVWGYSEKKEVLGKSISYFFEKIEEAEKVLASLRSKDYWIGEFTGIRKDKSLIKVVFNMLPTTIGAFKVLWESKPNVIISAGPSMAIPLLWLARVMGIKTIFIESWVRVHHKSKTGKLVYPISNLFFVQWPTMKKVYPKAIYAGRLS